MKRTVWMAVLCGVLAAGCISVGKKFDSSRVEDIKVGETSILSVMGMFGQPWSEKKMKDGTTRYLWQYTRGGFAVGVVEQQVLTVFADNRGVVTQFYVKDKAE